MFSYCCLNQCIYILFKDIVIWQIHLFFYPWCKPILHSGVWIFWRFSCEYGPILTWKSWKKTYSRSMDFLQIFMGVWDHTHMKTFLKIILHLSFLHSVEFSCFLCPFWHVCYNAKYRSRHPIGHSRSCYLQLN